MIQFRDPETGSIVSILAIQGADGKSAYEYALDGGYEGTEEEFIKSLLYNAEAADNNIIKTIENKFAEVPITIEGNNIVFSNGLVITCNSETDEITFSFK